MNIFDGVMFPEHALLNFCKSFLTAEVMNQCSLIEYINNRYLISIIQIYRIVFTQAIKGIMLLQLFIN